MRAGNSYHRIGFFAKQVSRDAYGASVELWNYNVPTISTRGEVRYTGGFKTLSNEEKFYAKSVELIIRYRSEINEAMRVQIDGTTEMWGITFMEIQGRKESIRLTLDKLTDNIPVAIIAPPTSLVISLNGAIDVDLIWVNNASNDGVVIERSINGNLFTEVVRIPKNVVPVVVYKDVELEEDMRYYYRMRAFQYNNYSAYTPVEIIETLIDE